VSEKLPNGVRFGDLAIELGLSNAELVTKSFKVGIKVITSDIANYQLSQFEADLLREANFDQKEIEPAKPRVKKKRKKPRQAKNSDDDLTTPAMFAKFYKRDVGEVIEFCNSNGFNIRTTQQQLTKRQIDALYKAFAIDEMELSINSVKSLQHSFGNLLQDVIALEARTVRAKRVHEIAKELGMTDAEVVDLGHKLGIGVKGPSSTVVERQADRLRARAERDGLNRAVQPPVASVQPVAKVSSKSKSEQKTKRISVLAAELKIQELVLRWLIDAVRATVIEGKQSKINLRDEAIVKAACEVWAKLPVDINTSLRMRISKIAKRSGATIKDLTDLCDEFNVKIQNKTFVSALDGIYLQALYSRKSVKAPPKRNEETVPQKVDVPSVERVQYRNTSYLRQDFLATSFKNSDFLKVNFGYADVSGSDFTGCSLRDSQLTRVRAVGAVFVNAKISNCSFDFADLTGASFLNSELSAVSFRKATFAETIWIDGRLINSEVEI